jgi:hypothetical protein
MEREMGEGQQETGKTVTALYCEQIKPNFQEQNKGKTWHPQSMPPMIDGCWMRIVDHACDNNKAVDPTTLPTQLKRHLGKRWRL